MTSRPLLHGTHGVPPRTRSHHLSTSALSIYVSPRSCTRALPPDTTVASLPSPVLFLCSVNYPRRRRRGMSSPRPGSACSAPGSDWSWPRFGEFPMTRCPVCPRVDLLERYTCVVSERGNAGREFIKYESNPCLGKDGKVGFVRICFNLA